MKARDFYYLIESGKNLEFSVLRVKFQREISRPLHVMEEVIKSLVKIAQEGGIYPLLSLEIVSLEGEVLFLIRVVKGQEELVKRAFFSQFEGLVISVVEDYAAQIRNILEEGGKGTGMEFVLSQDNSKPILTYKALEVEGDRDEKRIDPLAELLEGMTSLKKGEYLIFQLVLNSPDFFLPPFVSPSSSEPRLLIVPAFKQALVEVINAFLPFLNLPASSQTASSLESSEPQESSEPKERAQRKSTLPKANTTVRVLYVGHKESFRGDKINMVSRFLDSLSDPEGNSFVPFSPTLPFYKSSLSKLLETNIAKFWHKSPDKVITSFYDNLVSEKRLKALIERGLARLTPLYPQKGGTSLLCTEELTTLWHFPPFASAPVEALERAEFKIREAPPEVPVID